MWVIANIRDIYVYGNFNHLSEIGNKFVHLAKIVGIPVTPSPRLQLINISIESKLLKSESVSEG